MAILDWPANVLSPLPFGVLSAGDTLILHPLSTILYPVSIAFRRSVRWGLRSQTPYGARECLSPLPFGVPSAGDPRMLLVEDDKVVSRLPFGVLSAGDSSISHGYWSMVYGLHCLSAFCPLGTSGNVLGKTYSFGSPLPFGVLSAGDETMNPKAETLKTSPLPFGVLSAGDWTTYAPGENTSESLHCLSAFCPLGTGIIVGIVITLALSPLPFGVLSAGDRHSHEIGRASCKE